ncbi:NUMOD1 domain-containing DNA-binding protein [Priestia filamentosa]|uniref:NUMOD1 domain-containing DNA-binding protein n=1 Tax=Priestia filamentosa TaxID=1402861 RepID=UPI00397BA9BF
MSKGIYLLEINGKFYIGKDELIHKLTRIKTHLSLLEKGKHYNIYLQRAFLKYKKKITYRVLEEYEEIPSMELCIRERVLIQKYDSYKNGYNMTLGGEGGAGRKHDEPQLQRFYEIVNLLKEGKSNKFIAELYDLHDRYISLIRHKHRYEILWKDIEYEPTKSNDVAALLGSINEDEYVFIINSMLNGSTNKQIEEDHGLPQGTASRIRNRKLYKQWWEKYFNEQDSLKIKSMHQKNIHNILSVNGKRHIGRIVNESTRNLMKQNNAKSIRVRINDKEYSSFTEAEKLTGINRKVISSRAKSNMFPTYELVEIVESVRPKINKIKKEVANIRKSKKVKINGIVYSSMSEAERQLGINRKTIASRLESTTFPEYEFIGFSDNPQHKKSRAVSIEGVEYKSINQAALQLGVSQSVIRRKLEEDKYPNFKFI